MKGGPDDYRLTSIISVTSKIMEIWLGVTGKCLKTESLVAANKG